MIANRPPTCGASSGPVTSWSWDFGDGTTSTEASPLHSYTAAGVFTVSLTVTGPGGSDATIRTDLVTASEPAPVADLGAAPTTGPSCR